MKMRLFRRTRDTLAHLLIAPATWAMHFIVVYAVTAYRCAPNADIFKSITEVRLFVGAVTLVSLAFISVALMHAWRDWRAEGRPPHNRATIEDRERFLEFSTILLASLSFLGVILDALPALFFADCR